MFNKSENGFATFDDTDDDMIHIHLNDDVDINMFVYLIFSPLKQDMSIISFQPMLIPSLSNAKTVSYDYLYFICFFCGNVALSKCFEFLYNKYVIH